MSGRGLSAAKLWGDGEFQKPGWDLAILKKFAMTKNPVTGHATQVGRFFVFLTCFFLFQYFRSRSILSDGVAEDDEGRVRLLDLPDGDVRRLPVPQDVSPSGAFLNRENMKP